MLEFSRDVGLHDLHESLHALVDPAPAWIGSEPTDHGMTRSGRTCIASPRPGQGVNVAIARRLEKKENILFEKGIFRNSPPLSKTFHQLPYYFQVWNSQKRNPYFFQTFHARCEPCLQSLVDFKKFSIAFLAPIS